MPFALELHLIQSSHNSFGGHCFILFERAEELLEVVIGGHDNWKTKGRIQWVFILALDLCGLGQIQDLLHMGSVTVLEFNLINGDE